MNKAFLTIIMGSFVVTGCAHEWSRVTPIIAPDGSHVFAVACHGSPTNCWEAAGDNCPRGYDVLETDARNGFETRAFASNGSAGLHSSSTHDEEMMIKCHSKPKPAPEHGCPQGDPQTMSNMDQGAYLYCNKNAAKEAYQ